MPTNAILRIDLLGIDPLIWRRVRIPLPWRLDRVHRVFQTVMGWQNCHLHEYRVDGLCIGMPELDDMGDPPENERDWTLERLVEAAGREFLYVYDFGDDWNHRVVIEGREPSDNGLRPAPLCLAGQNATPPEGCGGPPGYKLLLTALRDPKHERHAELVQWVGGVFEPRGFDLNGVNRALREGKS